MPDLLWSIGILLRIRAWKEAVEAIDNHKSPLTARFIVSLGMNVSAPKACSISVKKAQRSCMASTTT